MARAPRRPTFEQLVERWDARLRAAFLESVYRLRDQAQIENIVRLLEAGDLDAAVRAVGLDPVAFRPYDTTFSEAFEQGGNVTAAMLPALRDATGVKVVVRFNMRNRQAEQWLQNYSSTRIAEMLDDQRRMVRAQLQAGMSLGENPRTVALRIVGRIGPQGTRQGGLIGLTEYQAQYTINYLRELESDNPAQALTRALRDRRFDARVLAASEGTGEPLTASEIDKMVQTYANRALRARAVAISRTEAMAALHQSQEEAFGQAVATGLLEKDQIGSTWRTSQDNRVRDTHATMEGQTVAYGEYFTTGAGVQLLYPGDPSGPPEEIINCRCWREPAVDFLKGIK